MSHWCNWSERPNELSAALAHPQDEKAVSALLTPDPVVSFLNKVSLRGQWWLITHQQYSFGLHRTNRLHAYKVQGNLAHSLPTVLR